jgi:hypothetical protein
MHEVGLREGGLYSLPDGRRFVAWPNGTRGYSLYRLRASSRIIRADYIVSEEGRLLSKGIPTRWRVDDLAETRKNADVPGAADESGDSE